MSDAIDKTPPAALEAVNITKHFTVRNAVGQSAVVRAVDNVTLRLSAGKIIALVGESGSGKTTIARLLALFYPLTSGQVSLFGKPVQVKHGRNDYYRRVQMIFQDPFGSLNSNHRVRYNLERALRLHGHARNRAEAHARVPELLERVSLTPPQDFLDKYPYELSGGQRQRVVIARALAVKPSVLLADEPISMLDVSIRLDMLNLLARLRDDEGLALLYITHDIASARYLSDEINVMYAGQMVEGGPKEDVIQRPMHPYTKLLIDSSPDPARIRSGNRRVSFASTASLGEPPSLVTPPSGCRFHPRCPFAMEECRTTQPERTELGNGHWATCWLHQRGQTDLLSK